VLPREAVSDGLHQAGERGAIREFDIGAALLAPALATILSVSAAAWEREPLNVFHERRAKIADLRLLMGVAVDEG